MNSGTGALCFRCSSLHPIFWPCFLGMTSDLISSMVSNHVFGCVSWMYPGADSLLCCKLIINSVSSNSIRLLCSDPVRWCQLVRVETELESPLASRLASLIHKACSSCLLTYRSLAKACSKRTRKIMSTSQNLCLCKGLNHGTCKGAPPPSLGCLSATPEMSLDIHRHNYLKKTEITSKNQPFYIRRWVDGRVVWPFSPPSLSNVI